MYTVAIRCEANNARLLANTWVEFYFIFEISKSKKWSKVEINPMVVVDLSFWSRNIYLFPIHIACTFRVFKTKSLFDKRL